MEIADFFNTILGSSQSRTFLKFYFYAFTVVVIKFMVHYVNILGVAKSQIFLGYA